LDTTVPHNAALLTLADSVDQADTPILKRLNLPQFKPTTTFRRREARLPFTGDQFF
jgi:hypothetical protein